MVRAGYSYGRDPGFKIRLLHFFLQKTVHRNISVATLFGTENVRENGGKTNPKCFGQLPLGTGSQRHMAEKFKET